MACCAQAQDPIYENRDVSRRLENDLASDHGKLYLALHPGLVERRILAARMESQWIDDISRIGIEANEICRGFGFEPSLRQPQYFGRSNGHRGNEALQRNVAGMN